MVFNVEQFLDDFGIGYKKKAYDHKGSPCTRYGLAKCFFDPSHTNNDACIFQYDTGAVTYKCQHDSCAEKNWAAVRAFFILHNVDLKKYWPNSNIISQDKSSRKEITYLSGAEVIAKPIEIEWIIKDMLVMFESNLIHASGGLGKSMFVLYLILSLASFANKGLFDKFFILKRRCSLVIGAENGRGSTYQRLKKMCNGSSDLKHGLKHIFFLSKYNDTTITGEVFSDESFCDFLVEFIKRIEQEQNVKIDILVIDPLISFSGAKNENDSADMRPSLDAIDGVCRQAKCTPIVIHHDKKDGDNYRGSTAINDWTRNRISLKRKVITENRITSTDSQGRPTGHRMVNIPVVRVTHEKCNNFQMFDPFLIRMTENLHFERISEQLSPKNAEKVVTVAQVLSSMGGYAESENALAKVYMELAKVSKNTAKKYILLAVKNKFIRQETDMSNGKSIYRYHTVSDLKIPQCDIGQIDFDSQGGQGVVKPKC